MVRFLLATVLSGCYLYAGPTLGPAAPFNVFVFNAFNETGSDTGGRIAAGTDSSFSSNFYAVTQNLNLTRDTYPATYNLVIKGTITLNPATNNKVNLLNGNAWVAIATDCAKIQTAGGGTCSSTPPSPIDFAAATSYFNILSNYYPTLAGTTVTGTSLTFNVTHRGLNVFYVSAANLAAASSIAFTNADATQDTIIVNVTGTTSPIALPNIGYTFNGTPVSGEGSPTGFQRVLWNFPTTASLTGGSWAGSILAPNAAVGMNNGQFIGQLVANSFTGNTEFHDFVFTGDASLPEPATWALCGLAMVILARLRRPKR